MLTLPIRLGIVLFRAARNSATLGRLLTLAHVKSTVVSLQRSSIPISMHFCRHCGAQFVSSQVARWISGGHFLMHAIMHATRQPFPYFSGNDFINFARSSSYSFATPAGSGSNHAFMSCASSGLLFVSRASSVSGMSLKTFATRPVARASSSSSHPSS